MKINAKCPICKKKVKNPIEIDVEFTCPNCGTQYPELYQQDEIICTNPDCNKSFHSLLIDDEVEKHTQLISKEATNTEKLKPKDLKKHMKSIQMKTKSFRKSMKKRKGKDFDFNKVNYRCSGCDNVMTKKKWDAEEGKCPECNKENYCVVETDPVKFVTVPSKQVIVTCEKFHILARYPRRD